MYCFDGAAGDFASPADGNTAKATKANTEMIKIDTTNFTEVFRLIDLPD
jgi:hypothetical protein